MTEQVIDAEVVPDDQAPEAPSAPSTAVAVREQPYLSVVPQVEATELVARLDTIRAAMNTAMTKDVDYGVIPGTGGKPTLLKPGAEKLGVLFQLDVQLVNNKSWGPGDHLTVESHATVYHAPTGNRLGFGEGLCTTREKKYGKRQGQRLCPTCGKAAIIKGKAEYGGGWVCFAKKDGCGAKFPDGDAQIEGQSVGEVENPDLPDVWNTVVKMAEKRARIDAILAVTGASALFTQDAEDHPHDNAPAPAAAEPADPHGGVIKPEMVPHMQQAILRIVGGDTLAAKHLHDEIVAKTGGTFRQAAAAALVLAGKALVTTPLERAIQAPDPTSGEVDRTVLEKIAFDKWQEAGLSGDEALKKVSACRTSQALEKSIQAAQKAVDGQREVAA